MTSTTAAASNPLQPLVAIHQRAVHQPNPLALLRRQAIELAAAIPRRSERAAGDVHADDLGELPIGEQPPQQLALAAAEIEHARGARCLQHVEDRVEPLLVEADRALDGRLLLVLLCRDGLFLGLFFRRQPGDGVADEPALVHQVAARR